MERSANHDAGASGDAFPAIPFRSTLRPSQADAIAVARRDLAAGNRSLHIVAPPGSGKTVLGLYLWACEVRRPAVVLSPNSAIQAQWAARTDLFDLSAAPPDAVSTDADAPGLLTSLTYQSVTLPRRGGDALDAQALWLWQDRLIERGEAQDPQEARVWIEDLARHNHDYYEQRLARYRKHVRDEMAADGDALGTLHASALATLERLRDCGVGLLILDECHHLMGHWGRVLADAHTLLGQPIVVGLTATPPDRDGRDDADVARYDAFFGPVDYEVPVPAVVKDGYLAPYQDLVYFVRPTADELSFVANADQSFLAMLDELCDTPPREPGDAGASEGLTDWLVRVLAERQLPTGPVRDWLSFERRDPALAHGGRVLLGARGIALPPGVPPLATPRETPSQLGLDTLVPVLDRYIRRRLRRSPDPADHARAERAIARLRMLGVQIGEAGPRACASPVGRVLAYSRAKARALLPILQAERAALGDKIRAVIVTDFEKTSAIVPEIAHLLDDEAGGAIAAFRTLLSDPSTDALDPVLVTGSTVLVDDDLAPRFLELATQWLDARSVDAHLTLEAESGFAVLVGRGAAWDPRVYVEMITDLFLAGVTRCLVGTRGLLGEGWDARSINVLIDLTTVTTSMSINQLRGRSIRLDPDDPEKLADNWDVVCLAPEFAKGLDDYHRFIKKHKSLFGVTDDGAVEKGAGHVHAAFAEIEPEGIEQSAEPLNAEMIARPGRRPEFRALWRIGEPYHAEPITAVELRGGGGANGFPPFADSTEPWSDSSLTLAVAHAVLGALAEAGLIAPDGQVAVGQRGGGYVRAFLRNAGSDDGALFAACLAQALGPLDRPRYIIPRHIDDIRDTWLSRLLPDIVARYFRRRNRRFVMLHAVPDVLARNKELADLYTRHWNRHVSPGQARFAYQGEGARLLADARRDGLAPNARIRNKEVFL